jgi:hypothetical protein
MTRYLDHSMKLLNYNSIIIRFVRPWTDVVPFHNMPSTALVFFYPYAHNTFSLEAYAAGVCRDNSFVGPVTDKSLLSAMRPRLSTFFSYHVPHRRAPAELYRQSHLSTSSIATEG